MTEQPQSIGIQNTKEMLKFIVTLGMSVDKALEDGKVSVLDLPLIMAPMSAAPAAFGDMALIPKEVSDLSAEEKAELVSYFETEFDIKDDKAEHMIEKALKLGLAVYEFIQDLKAAKA